MKESRLSKALKKAEIAIRRAFISSLQLRTKFSKSSAAPQLPLELPDDPTILFLRQDRLGDAIVSTPVFTEMYKKYPRAKFIVLLGENNQGIAELLPLSCEVFIYRKKPIDDIDMLLKLRKKRIDILIDLMDNPSSTSSILTAIIAAKYSIGIDKANSSSYNITVPLIDRAKFHIARRLVELLKPFGIDPESVSLKPQLKDILSQKVGGRIGLVISAGAKSRYVPTKTNAEIANKIIEQGLALEVKILFHPNDKKFADEVRSLTTDLRITLASPTQNFVEYVKQIRSCEYVISPDTSALHLCSAYGIPVLGLYAPFPPELHYWTPTGVPYEMIIQTPYLEYLESDNVISHLKKLIEKVKPQIEERVLSA